MFVVQQMFGDFPQVADPTPLRRVSIFQLESHKLARVDANHGVNWGEEFNFKRTTLPIRPMFEDRRSFGSPFERDVFRRQVLR
jgi:hypothetical protein